MGVLEGLSLGVFSGSEKASAIVQRRAKLAAKIEQQLKFAADASYKPTKIVWSKRDDGSAVRVEVPKRIKHWWTERQDGTVMLTVRYGSKPLELAKGKNAIVLKSVGEVEGVLRSLSLAVLSGELDAILSAQVTSPKRKVAQ